MPFLNWFLFLFHCRLLLTPFRYLDEAISHSIFYIVASKVNTKQQKLKRKKTNGKSVVEYLDGLGLEGEVKKEIE